MRLAKRERRRAGERANVTRELFSRLTTRRTSSAWAFVDANGVVEHATFGEVARESARWSSLLRASGGRPGERVVILAGRRPDWLAVVLGALNSGAVAVPYPGVAAADEVAEVASHSGAVLVVEGDGVEGDGADAGLDGVAGATLLRHDEAARLLRDQPTTAPTFDTGTGDLAVLLYGRGDDGALRAAAHTHASCLAQLDAGEHWIGAAPGDRLWCTAEPGAPESVLAALAAWGRAAQLVVHAGDPPPADAVELVGTLRIELLWLDAAQYAGFAAVERPDWVEPPRVRSAVLSGDAPDAAVADSFAAKYGTRIRRGTLRPETGILGGDVPGAGETPGALTGALPGREPVILDRSGGEAATGDPGELVVRAGAPGVFAGWWDPAAQGPEPQHGPWVRLGDVAVRDQTGSIRTATEEEVRRLVEAREAAAVEELRRAEESLRLEQERLAAAARRREAERQRLAAEREAAERAKAQERLLREEQREREGEEARRRREQETADGARRQAEEEARKRQADEDRRRAEEAERRRAAAERARRGRDRRKNETPQRDTEATTPSLVERIGAYTLTPPPPGQADDPDAPAS